MYCVILLFTTLMKQLPIHESAIILHFLLELQGLHVAVNNVLFYSIIKYIFLINSTIFLDKH